MNKIARLSLTLFNIYLISSINFIQVLCADRPISRLKAGEQEDKTQESKFSPRSLNEDENDFSPSLQIDGEFGSKLGSTKTTAKNERGRTVIRRRVSSRRADRYTSQADRYSSEADRYTSQADRYSSEADRYTSQADRYSSQSDRYSPQPDGPSYSLGTRKSSASSYRRPTILPYPETQDRGYDRGGSYYDDRSNLIDRAYDREVVPKGYHRLPYHSSTGSKGYFESVRPAAYNPYRSRYEADLQRDDDYTRFPGSRPQPFDNFNQYGLEEESQPSPGLFGSLLNLFSPPRRPGLSSSSPAGSLNEPSYELIYNNNVGGGDDRVSSFNKDSDTFVPTLDDYDDFNLDYRDEQNSVTGQQYDFKDVIYSIRNNESRVETFKKLLSAVTSFTDRAGTDPSFMIFNLPITLLSILGGFYAVSAIAIIGYKYVLLSTGNTNGTAVSVLPLLVFFIVPALVATVFLVARSAIDGQINLGGLARGDFKKALRQDFDPVDFAYDLAVGSSALLGLGWVVSVVL